MNGQRQRKAAHPIVSKACFSSVLLSGLVSITAQSQTNDSPGVQTGTMQLGLQDCTRRVVEMNEGLQVKALEWAISQRKLRATKGVFEPDWVGSAEHRESLKKFTVERQVSYLSSGIKEYEQKNNTYAGGLEFLAPTGAKVHIGLTVGELHNNIARQYKVNQEVETFAGISLTQPLMKNAGLAVNMANIRLAAVESELAFQEYRRQLMLTVARVESAYWELFQTQEQEIIRKESIRIALKLLEDKEVRLKTGKASELDVIQAEAGVSLREARAKEARQKKLETMNRLASLLSAANSNSVMTVVATDSPTTWDAEPNFGPSMRESVANNPDYLSQIHQLSQEKIKLSYTRNQLWPQLDLKASYGANGYGTTASTSLSDMEESGYEDWGVGVELRIPFTGGSKNRHEFAAAKIRQKQALLNLKTVEVEISSAMETAIRRVLAAKDNIGSYQKVAFQDQKVLENTMSRVEAGKASTKDVLEAEDRVTQSKSAAVDSLVEFQKAVLEWELIRGATLSSRQLELTQAQLKTRTDNVIRRMAAATERWDRKQRGSKISVQPVTGAPDAMDTPAADPLPVDGSTPQSAAVEAPSTHVPAVVTPTSTSPGSSEVPPPSGGANPMTKDK